MPIWLDLKQQHGRLTATTGSRHLLAARRPPAIGKWGVRDSERKSVRGIRGIRVWRRVLGEECSERSYWLDGDGGLKKKQLVLPETARRRSAVFGRRHLFSANNRLAGREEERRGEGGLGARSPACQKIRRAADFKKRLRSEGERIRKKKRKEKKERKKKKAHGGPSVSDLPLRRQANTFLRRTCCLKNTRLHTLIWQRGSPRPTIRYLI